MNLGWRFMIPAGLVWIVLTGAGILAVQAIRS
jgi:NADH:ubiquinone oxidoreductase subunit H